MHGEGSPPFKEHMKVRFSPSAEKMNRALRSSVVRSGPDSIITCGGMPPISQLHSAGTGSTLPAGSTARTSSSCSPKRRSLYVVVCPHGRKKRFSVISSSEHSNLTSGMFAPKTNVAVVSSVTSCGPESMNVSGSRSTVHPWTAGDWSGMPTGWTARTANVCSPSATLLSVVGDSQASNGAESSEHSKVALNWSAEKVKSAVASVVGSSGPESIVVSGSSVSAGTSTVHSKTAGGSSTRRKRFVDCTSKVWAPTGTSGSVTGDWQAANSAPSNEHMNVVLGWLAEKVNVATVSVVVAGAAGTSVVIVVRAGPTTVQLSSSGLPSTF